jgi:hypothetical protein
LALLNDDNPNNDIGVCGKLGAFINKVNANSGNGLAAGEAEQLLEEANSIKDDMGC